MSVRSRPTFTSHISNLRSIRIERLNRHIPRPQMIHALCPRPLTHRLLKPRQRNIALSSNENIRFLITSSIRRDCQTWEYRTGLEKVFPVCCGRIENLVVPGECLVFVEIVPETVAHDVGDGFLGLDFGLEEEIGVDVFLLDWVFQDMEICVVLAGCSKS